MCELFLIKNIGMQIYAFSAIAQTLAAQNMAWRHHAYPFTDASPIHVYPHNFRTVSQKTPKFLCQLPEMPYLYKKKEKQTLL